mmetsp:Transcript_49020/g.88624  ORF Transcript_49020/g.88624 Transcript_49020/m.88624 type:complete len:281 (-) Transcript_49020:511-1353(-)
MLSHVSTVPASQQGVDLIEENHRWGMLLHKLLKCLDAALGIAIKLRHDVPRADMEKCGTLGQLYSSCAGQHRLTAARGAEQQQPVQATTDAAEERRIRQSRPDDRLAQRDLGIIEADDIFKANLSSHLFHIYARALQLGLDLGEIVIFIGVLALFACFLVSFLDSVHSILASCPYPSLRAQLAQLELNSRAQVPLVVQLRLQIHELLVGWRHGPRPIDHTIARGCRPQARGGDHSRDIVPLLGDLRTRLRKRHSGFPFMTFVWQCALDAIEVGGEANLTA